VSSYTRGMAGLNEEELSIWQSIHGVLLLLPTALDRQLQRDSQLSYLEYYVLAGLSEMPQRTGRLSDLAVLTTAELSRISHLIARMEKRGLVHRRPDPDDGRYTNAVLTDAGWDLVQAAAPGHVSAVRDLIFEGLDAGSRQALRESMDHIVAALARNGTDVPWANPPERQK
jgi:DNA-binding MarR family transcriptional regulator